jgi:hypothetical protein
MCIVVGSGDPLKAISETWASKLHLFGNKKQLPPT